MFSESHLRGGSLSESQLPNDEKYILPKGLSFWGQTHKTSTLEKYQKFIYRYVFISTTNTKSAILANKEK